MKWFKCLKCEEKDKKIGFLKDDRDHGDHALKVLIENMSSDELNRLFTEFNPSSKKGHQLLANLIVLEMSSRANNVLKELKCHTSKQKEGQV